MIPRHSVVCDECGDGFTPAPRSRPDTRFCSHKCRNRQFARVKYATDEAYRERKCEQRIDGYYRMDALAYNAELLRLRRKNALQGLRASRDRLAPTGTQPKGGHGGALQAERLG